MPHPATPSAGEGETQTASSVLPSANSYPSGAASSSSSSSSLIPGLLPDARREKLSIEQLQARANQPGGHAGAEVDLRVEELRAARKGDGKKRALVPPKGWLHFVAGGVGGMCGAIVTSPLDVVKTRLQSDIFRSATKSSTASGAAAVAGSNGVFQSARRLAYHFVETGQLLRDISVKEGPKALFKGLGPTLVGVVPARSINFFTYGNGKIIIADHFNGGKETPVVHLCAAAIAGITTATATNPIWVVKTRLQLESHASERAAQDGRKAAIRRDGQARTVGPTTRATPATASFSSLAKGPATSSSAPKRMANSASASFFKPAPSPQRPSTNSLQMTLRIIKAEGIAGLYKGMSASYLGVAEGTIQWVLYERLKGLARGSALAEEERQVSRFRKWMGTVGAAGTAKMVASLITYPHEVVRTRLRQEPPPGQPRKYTGLLQTIKLVWREEGAASLYGGLSAHLLRVVPNAAIMFVVYETMLSVSTAPTPSK